MTNIHNNNSIVANHLKSGEGAGWRGKGGGGGGGGGSERGFER